MISRTSTSRAAAAALLCAGMAVLAASPLAAQGYRRTPGDTLRYHLVEAGKLDMKGMTSSENQRELTVAIAFGADGNARVWFEKFSAVMKAQGREMPVGGSPLNQPVDVAFGASGPAQTLTNITDPGARGGPGAALGDVLPKLPAQPLAAGVEWADTVGGKRDLPDGGKVEMQYVEKYRVVGDTAFAGGKALVIVSRGEGTNKMTRTTADGTSETRVRTSETGRILFSAELGRLLGWERSVDTSSRTMMRGSNAGADAMSYGRTGGPRGLMKEASGGAEGHGHLQTTIELLAPQQAKAAPTK